MRSPRKSGSATDRRPHAAPPARQCSRRAQPRERQDGARCRCGPGRRARAGRCTRGTEAGAQGLVHRQGPAAQAGRLAGARISNRRAAAARGTGCATGCARRPPAHGAPEPRAAGELACAEARTRADRHAGSRTLCAGVAVRPVDRRLGAAASRCAAASRAHRRVPGHQQPAVAGVVRLAVVVCRRWGWSERTAATGTVHRGRSETEHLPLSWCRAARVRSRAHFRGRRARRTRACMQPHAPQRQRGGAGRECRVRADGRGRRVRGLHRAQHGAHRRPAGPRVARARSGARRARGRAAPRRVARLADRAAPPGEGGARAR
jgi:hypothetical protein